MVKRLPHKLILPALLAACFASTALYAQDATLDRAKRIIAEQKGKGRAAFDLLVPLEEKRAGEPDFDYLLGLAAIDAGEFTRAVFALERVLAVRPDHPQARAEIARAYFLMGENKAARAEFEAVKAGKPPAEVIATIDRFLSALDQRQAGLTGQRTGATFYLEAGVGYDTNANTATSASGFAAPGLGIFALSPGAGARANTFMTVSGGVSGRYAINDQWALTGGANINRRINSLAARAEHFIGATRVAGMDTFDTGSVDGNAGVVHVRGDHEITAAVQAQSFDVDNARFRDAFGGLLQWRYALTPAQQVVGYLQSSRLVYPNLGTTVIAPGVPAQTDRNAYRNVVGAAWANAIDVKYLPTVYAGLYAGEERLMQDSFPEFAHKMFGARVGAQVTLSPSFTANANLSYEDRRYGMPASAVNILLFGNNHRLDREWNLRVGASYAFSKNWSVNPSVTVTENQSSWAVNTFRRNLVMATLRYDLR